MNRLYQWFEQRVEPFPEQPLGPPPQRLTSFLWHYSRPVWPWLVLVGVLSAAVSLLEVGLFGFLGRIVDWLGQYEPDAFIAAERGRLFVMAAVVIVCIPLLSALHAIVTHQVIYGNYPMIVRWLGHRLLLRQHYAFYQDEFAGRIATRLMQVSLAVRETVMKFVNVLVYVGVYFIGGLVLIASFDKRMVLPFLLWVCGYALLLRWFLPRMRDISQRQASARSIMTGRVVDSYTNIMTVKLYAHAGHESGYAREGMQQFLDTVHPQMRLAATLDILFSILNSVLFAAVAAVGILLWTQGQFTAGGLAIAVGLVLRLQGMAHWIMWELAGLFENIGVVYDGMELLSREAEVLDAVDAQRPERISGRIEFDAVDFHYGKAGGVIDSLTLEIAVGEKIGLVGPSGAGKTTLGNLLLRLYDVEGGAIRIDGIDVRSLAQDQLRENIGVVTQESSLLHRSVLENIRYGRADATLEEVVAAARRANAHGFIEGLVDSNGREGYEAHVGDRGVKLSGGQRQRIAIARVFLKNAPILLLDEATSALDSEVEAAIQENLNELMQGKTVIAIAHRLSTIAALDRLVVMDGGRIIESGSHVELVQRGGLYARLWARQSGGFIGEQGTPADD